MENPLIPAGEADISPEEEQSERAELLRDVQDASLLALREELIKQRGRALQVKVKEDAQGRAETMSQKLRRLTDGLMDDELVDRMLAGIETAKDYNEAVKAAHAIYEMVKNQTDVSFAGEDLSSVGRKKINIMFQSGDTKMAVQMDK